MAVRKGIYNTENIRKGLITLMGVGLLVMSATTPLASSTDTHIGKVVRVIDGDTLTIRSSTYLNGKSMRLAGVDAPETYNHKKAQKAIMWCGIHKEVMFSYGEITKKYLTRTILNQDVKYVVVGIGRFGRPVIYIPGITEDLVSSGLVDVVDFRNLPRDIYSRLHNLEVIARQKKIGLWEHIDLSCMNSGGRK